MVAVTRLPRHPDNTGLGAGNAVMACWMAACSLLAPQSGQAGEAVVGLRVVGPAETVFSYTHDRCDAEDIPDAPARAIRLQSGQVRLFAPHFHNRVLSGPGLLQVRPDCRIVFSGAERDDPAAFDDRGWIVSPYTLDGHTVHAVIHNEFQGHRRRELCPTVRYMDCWYNALTTAVSHDAGMSFRRSPGHAVAASLPYRYDQVVGSHRGYFNPSNIVERDGHLYMFAFATEAYAQRPGNCLLRTDRLHDAAAWRAWDGGSFEVRFIDPYSAGGAPPDRHVCAPVDVAHLRWPVTSLVRVAGSETFIALMMNAGRGGGVFAATSSDLVRWSEPVQVLAAQGERAWRCGEPPPLAYPSLIDPASGSANFETVGATAMLFLTRFNPHGCRTSMDRDLIRVPVAISPKERSSSIFSPDVK